MKFAFGLLEFVIVLIIAIAVYIFVPKDVISNVIPKKSDIESINKNKTEIDRQIKELERLKIEHDKSLNALQ